LSEMSCPGSNCDGELMAAPRLKFSEFIDVLLVKLYELDRSDSSGDKFFDLNAVAREIKDNVPQSWVFDAAKVLETRGLADCIFTFGGVHAQLSGEGRLYVEEGRGITQEVVQDRAKFFSVNVSGGNVQIVGGDNSGQLSQTVTIEEERAPAFRILTEARAIVEKDRGLPEVNRAEALTALELIRLQLKKPEPNRSIIAAVLDPLSKIASIAGAVANLVKLLNG